MGIKRNNRKMPFIVYKKIYDFRKIISVLVLLISIFLLFFIPFVFVFFLITILSVFLIGTFNPFRLKESIYVLCILLLVIFLLTSPICYFIFLETDDFHLNEKIDPVYNHPKIVNLTDEFKQRFYDDFDDPQTVINELSYFVRQRIPYKIINDFSTTTQALQTMESDCFGRALIGFAILKNLDYEVYIVYSSTINHTWLRIYENGVCYEDDSTPKKYIVPLVQFDEDEIFIADPVKTLELIFTNGIYKDELISYGFTNFDFSIPLFLLLFFLITIVLIHENEKNFLKYVIFLIIAFVLVYFIVEINMNYNEFLKPLIWIIVSGVYLRIVYLLYHLNFLKKQS